MTASEPHQAVEAGPFITTHASVRRTPGWHAAFSWASIALFAALTPALFFLGMTKVALFLLLGIEAALIARPYLPLAEQPGTLRADTRGVHLDGQLLVARNDIRSSLILPRRDGRAMVRLEHGRARKRLELLVANEADANSLLQGLELGTSRAISRIVLPLRHLVPPFDGVVVVGVMLMMVFLSTFLVSNILAHPEVFTVGPLAAVLLLQRLRTHLTIAPDGLVIRSFGISRFVPFHDLVGCHTYDVRAESGFMKRGHEVGVVLSLKTGEILRLRVELSHWGSEVSVTGLRARIEEAWRAHDAYRTVDAERMAEHLAPAGRQLDDWLDALRRLGSGASAGHRNAPIPADHLWRMLENPSSPPTVRAGAAVALSASPSVDHERLANSARAIAQPRLRVAIEASAGAREAEIEAAMEALALEEEKAAKRPRRRFFDGASR
ncbi:hypothetical protein [Chondromyces crocatus]|uniref:Uncharacterized protein n=1 Tax=Chondromyces crocatus TaxID=52 RepID=A0A0K1EHT5_CHOCO|nr:hypothetical protein [Chondromyces crocatus]AKT40138.1 uncharacterized protein CMC5_042910 [Chondromyces crocatus]